MRKIRDVPRLHAGGLSKRQIAASMNIGRTSARDYINRARRAGLGWPLPDDLTDEDLERRLFPSAAAVFPDCRPSPDWRVLHCELRRSGVTLSLLWEEYRAVHPQGFGYSRFCELYRAWKGKPAPTMCQNHVAGEKSPSITIPCPMSWPGKSSGGPSRACKHALPGSGSPTAP